MQIGPQRGFGVNNGTRQIIPVRLDLKVTQGYEPDILATNASPQSARRRPLFGVVLHGRANAVTREPLGVSDAK